MKPKLSKYSQTAEQIRKMHPDSLRDMRSRGMTYEAIGAICGASCSTITLRCIEYGIDKPKR